MEKILSHPSLNHECLPDNVLFTHLAVAQHEVLASLNMSIDANKMVQSNLSLVNKSALLTIPTLNVNERNIQIIIKVLGIHPRMI